MVCLWYVCVASINVIPRSIVTDVELQPCGTTLKTWDASAIKPIGKCRLPVRNTKTRKKYSVEFIVVEQDYTPLLGKTTSEGMGYITVHYENISAVSDIPAKYDEVFKEEVGNLPGEVHLTIDQNAAPHAIASCRVPVHLKKKVEKKLKEMTEMNIVEKVDKPTEWVSRMVTSLKKNGDIRVCIDPQALNKALKREMHPLPIIEDILPELSEAKIFSKFDLRNGYWHCNLDEESSNLTTFQTPFGRYKWKRLPFGLAVSSEIFQKKLIAALDGIEGVICVADDILLYGVGEDEEKAKEDHNKKLEILMERCKHHGIRLNKAKTEMMKKEIIFLGHKITNRGVEADPSKIESIAMMRAPENATEARRFCGMVNYLAKFMPQLTEIMEPIRKLTPKTSKWTWGKQQEISFENIKRMVTQAPLLSYYDQNKDLTIQCDASKKGCGAVLLQDDRPLCYASKTLTDTETRYAVIEKEMLAVTFALKKFHQYTFGRHTIVNSDHRPLEAILKKPLDSAPKRLQGMILNAQQYDFNLVYKPGKEMHIADLLSRAHLKMQETAEFDYINAIDYIPIRSERITRMKRATLADETLQILITIIQEGWPDEKSELPPQAAAYFHCRDEVAVYDGLVYKGSRVVVPSSMRNEIKDALHEAHTGIESTLRRARECVYWPGMNPEIKMTVSECEICNKYKSSQQKESLMTHDPNESERLFQKIGVDLMSVGSRDFLITVDYYSSYWEVDELRKTSSKSVIQKLKRHFARYGIPSIVISDNGPQFYCEEFGSFAREWDFEHRTSSPGHPKSNGMVELAVKSAKKIITRAGADAHKAILSYRNTPQEDGMSPVQKFFGRRTRTPLPTTAALLQPKLVDPDTHKTMKRIKNAKSAVYYDRYSKDLEALEEGNTVRIKPMTLGSKTWKKGVITKRLDERSYEVDTNEGTLRRNRVYLRQTNEKEDDVQNEQEKEQEANERKDEKATIKTPAKAHLRDTEMEETNQKQVQTQEIEPETPKPALRRSTRNIKKPVKLDL